MFRVTGHLVFLALLTAGLFGFSAPARAQQATTFAALSGRVQDGSGAVVAGAEVSLTNVDVNQTSVDTTDQEGIFRFSHLRVGSYRLEVSFPGFAARQFEFSLTVGQSVDMPVRLDVAGRSETVNVVSEIPVVETVRTQLAQTIQPAEVSSLPLNGRNYLDLALLTPGVSRQNQSNNDQFAETSAVPGTTISINGQRNLSNAFVVDGLSANDDAASLPGTFYSQEVVREFQVVTSGGIAEFGRASSGAINILTKSGTNQWRGTAYGFLRNRALDARNAFAAQRDPFTQAQYGASIGGPILRDRTFLFSNFEQQHQNRTGYITISPASVAAVNDRLDQTGYAGPRIQAGGFETGYDFTTYFARVDHKLNDSNTLTARYSLYDIASRNARGVGGLGAPSRGTAVSDRDNTIALQETAMLSPRAVNELRFQYLRSGFSQPVNDLLGPAVSISGVANFGTFTSSPTARDTNLFQVADNITWQAGKHSIKAGVDVLYERVNIVFPGAAQGSYSFSSLANFLVGNYNNFSQAFGVSSQFQSNPNVGLFIQDEWRLRPDLTVNAGLRWDYQGLSEPIDSRPRNFGPRVGLAWAPGDRKTVIRAGYGIYFDRIPLRAVSNALQRDGSKYRVAVYTSPAAAGAPVFPGVLPEFPAGLTPSISAIDPDIPNSYGQQTNLQVERELPWASSISVNYVHLRGIHIIMSRNINLPVSNRPNPDFANISQYFGGGDSYYNGMTVSANHRSGRWMTFRLSYTLSKTTDNAQNAFFNQAMNPFDLKADIGRANNDQRHRVVWSGTLTVPRNRRGTGWRRAAGGFEFSHIFTYASAYPFNLQTGGSLFGDGNNNARPVGVDRNTGEGFDFSSLDLRLARRFPLTERWNVDVLAESFNTLNRVNLLAPNGTITSASFGQATNAADPRQIQFGMRLNF